ncbi:hypothetical protein POTOM_004099 [Populus tomentosa]|uniref:Calnexin n=1 Tax=Populus tomentosa TaxID=118781 RepID=A0A8X8D5D2_POPTO|nr:hypothetical protein POTOM_004099 [Populus tomentosa]
MSKKTSKSGWRKLPFFIILGSPIQPESKAQGSTEMERSWKLIPQLLLIGCFVFQICASYDDVVAPDLLSVVGFAIKFALSSFSFLESTEIAFLLRLSVCVDLNYERCVWKFSKSEGHDDYGLLVSEKAKRYVIVKELDNVFSLTDGTVVLQFEVRLQNGLECGGAYLKYLRPQECGSTNKVHFIFKLNNPKSGESVKHHLKHPPSVPSDKFSHVYTAILKPDNELKILIDGEEKKANFLSAEDFEPALIPPKTIPDPDDRKPEDRDERAKIPDPDAVKPDDWDEDAPMEIEDKDAVKPEGWLDDEPEEIDDPDALKPGEWDEEEDGEWEPPKNDNPNIEIWTMLDGIFFDNILIASDEKVADTYRETTWKPKFEVEKEKLKAEEATAGHGISSFKKQIFNLLYKIGDIPFLGAYKPKIIDLIEQGEKQPNKTIGILASVAIVIFTIFYRILFGGRRPVADVPETSSADAAVTSFNQGSSTEREREDENDDENEDEDAAVPPRRRATRRET